MGRREIDKLMDRIQAVATFYRPDALREDARATRALAQKYPVGSRARRALLNEVKVIQTAARGADSPSKVGNN